MAVDGHRWRRLDGPTGAQGADAHRHRPRCGAASGTRHQRSFHAGRAGTCRRKAFVVL